MSSAWQEAPKPRSPPRCPDLCGRRRLQLELSALSGEAELLQEELQLLEKSEPLHSCCKDVVEFAASKSDPFARISRKTNACYHAWRWIRSKLCCCFSSHYSASWCKDHTCESCYGCWFKSALEPECACCCNPICTSDGPCSYKPTWNSCCSCRLESITTSGCCHCWNFSSCAPGCLCCRRPCSCSPAAHLCTVIKDCPCLNMPASCFGSCCLSCPVCSCGCLLWLRGCTEGCHGLGCSKTCW